MIFSKSICITSIIVSLGLTPIAAIDNLFPRNSSAPRRVSAVEAVVASTGGQDEYLSGFRSTGKLAAAPRMLYGNDTSPWGDTETMRWRQLETVDEHGGVLVTYTLEFNCARIGEVCNNMCYGALCKNIGWHLTIDRTAATAARKRNACGKTSPNYCSVNYKPKFAEGYSCDEYPFASTSEALLPTTMTSTRCVPKAQNSIQGGTITAFYNSGDGLPDGTPYTVALQNWEGSENCRGYSGGAQNCEKGNSDSGKSQM